MLSTTSAPRSEIELTAEQIAKASHHLTTTRDILFESVAGLSGSQWHFRGADHSWSIADNVEHLVLIEVRVHAIIGNMNLAPEAADVCKQAENDEFILKEVPKRTTKVKSPEPVCPEGRWSGFESLQRLIAGREQTIRLLSAPLLRGRVRPHPLFGPWDGYQWLLAVGSHTERHTEQIREVKADPDYPLVARVHSVDLLH
jgi:DinB superfamily